MNNIKCPMCTDCPDNCPLDTEEDTREHSADYYKGKTSGIDELSDLIDRLLWNYDRDTYKDLSEKFKESARLLKGEKND